MFGYLRPLEPELLVKEQETYRALYCGLCRTMRKKVSFFASLSLNYDFVFLSILRAELSGENFQYCKKRCPVHPLKARGCTSLDSDSLENTALVHLALVYEKMKDDLRDRDASFFKRIAVRCYYPLLAARVQKLKKKDPRFRVILEHASGACDKLFELEKQGCADIDELAHVCAEGIANACCVGLDSKAWRLMYAASSVAGRLIYLLDAFDDLKDDEKRGCFNPFLQKYQTTEEALNHLEEINLTLALYAKELDAAVDLIALPARFAGLCSNITQKGIPNTVRRVVEKHSTSAVERETK